MRFQSKLTGINISDGKVKSVTINNNEEIAAQSLILATGHSAEDVYTMLKNLGIALEAKGFAMGVRVEHPRDIIDEIRYKKADTTCSSNLVSSQSVCFATKSATHLFLDIKKIDFFD